MGYDVEFIQAPTPANAGFPLTQKQARAALANAIPFDDIEAVREILLGIEGAKPGPGDNIDFLGRGLSYARLNVRPEAVHVENNCNARDLLMIYDCLLERYPKLLIVDLQSKDVHNGVSFLQWWSKPL